MKKLFAILIAVCCISSASAVSYKGYVETFGGLSASTEYDAGGAWGVATSHGVEIIDGLFVGAGIEFALGIHEDYGYYDYSVEAMPMLATFAECRYNFLRYSAVSPFVGARLGGGYDGYSESGAFYFSPAVGCTFNFTDDFGMDLSLGYDLYSSTYYDYDYVESSLANILAVRIGIHF